MISIDQFIRSGFAGLTNAESPEVALCIRGFSNTLSHNHGFYGVENWNRRAEGLVPSDQMSPCPVVIKVNDYTVGLFNGDDGICLGQRAYLERRTEIGKLNIKATESSAWLCNANSSAS